MRTALKWTAWLVLGFLVALALFILFGMNLLRAPLERAVADATGRELRIEGDLEPLWDWTYPKFRAEEVRFANPPWATDELMFVASAVEASVSVLPLFRGRVVVPQVHLEGARLNLEQDSEGRKNWILDGKQQKEDARSPVFIHLLTLDRGELRYIHAAREIDVLARLSSDASGIDFAAEGKYAGADARASGHAGPVLSLRDATEPFPLQGKAKIGATVLEVDGRITGIAGLESFDMALTLRGKSLSDLYDIVKVAFPDTPPYATSGRLIREGRLVRYEEFTGKVGKSDLSGTLQVDASGERPFMQGELRSKVMDFGDLGILIGTRQPRQGGVLPDSDFDPQRWGSVDADVRIQAATIRRPEQLPIEDLSARIRMKDRVLRLDPLEFGIAGGELIGPVVLDGRGDTIRAEVKMRVRDLKLARLFPTIEQNKGSVGDLNGVVELSGAGKSVAAMLATANGKIGVFMDDGTVSRLMMELAALDLWDAARVKLKGDDQIPIRCAIADFSVKDGLMQANAFVVDTEVVLVEGAGVVNLKDEAMNLRLDPKPKDSSIASLNSPLYLRGTFTQPKLSADVAKIATKGLGAVVLGAINPLLAVLPLLQEAKGGDSNCARLIAQAASSGRSAASSGPAKRPPRRSAR